MYARVCSPIYPLLLARVTVPPTLFLSFFLIMSITMRPLLQQDLGGVFGGLLGPSEQGAAMIPPGSSTSRQEHGLSTTVSTIYANGEATKVHKTTESCVTSILAPTINEITASSENSWPSAWSSSSASIITPWPTSPVSYTQDAMHMPASKWKAIRITVFYIMIISHSDTFRRSRAHIASG